MTEEVDSEEYEFVENIKENNSMLEYTEKMFSNVKALKCKSHELERGVIGVEIDYMFDLFNTYSETV